MLQREPYKHTHTHTLTLTHTHTSTNITKCCFLRLIMGEGGRVGEGGQGRRGRRRRRRRRRGRRENKATGPLPDRLERCLIIMSSLQVSGAGLAREGSYRVAHGSTSGGVGCAHAHTHTHEHIHTTAAYKK